MAGRISCGAEFLSIGQNLSAARDEFQRALDLQPTYAAAAYNLARTLVTEQKPAEAIPYYRSCARNLGHRSPALLAKPAVFGYCDRYDEAIARLAVAERSNSQEAAPGISVGWRIQRSR